VVTADVLGEVVERAGREDHEWAAGIHGYGGSARDRSVATADAEHLGALGRRAQHLRQAVVRTEFDDLGFRQFLADLGDHAIARAAARGGVDDQNHTLAVRPRRCLDAQWLGGGQGVVDDRRDQAPTQRGDRRADREAGQHVAGVVRAGRDPREPDQAGQDG
jgi:hypothetical protein